MNRSIQVLVVMSAPRSGVILGFHFSAVVVGPKRFGTVHLESSTKNHESLMLRFHVASQQLRLAGVLTLAVWDLTSSLFGHSTMFRKARPVMVWL